MATRPGLSRSIRLSRDDPQEVAAFLWAATKAEIIEIVAAGIRATGTVIPSESMAAHRVAIERTYRTGSDKPSRAKPLFPPVAVSTTALLALAQAPVNVVAPDIDGSHQKTAEAARLKAFFMSTMLGGGISS